MWTKLKKLRSKRNHGVGGRTPFHRKIEQSAIKNKFPLFLWKRTCVVEVKTLQKRHRTKQFLVRMARKSPNRELIVVFWKGSHLSSVVIKTRSISMQFPVKTITTTFFRTPGTPMVRGKTWRKALDNWFPSLMLSICSLFTQLLKKGCRFNVLIHSKSNI